MKKLIFLAILLLSIFLRVWKLDSFPISLFGDEVDLGYQAYSILKTGKDYLGNPWPVSFKSFAEYRLPLNIYIDVPFVAVFGLNEMGVRLPNVIAGVFSVVGIYLLTRLIFGQRVGLISAFLMSISPWHIFFSRQSNDATILVPLTIFGAWAFVKGLKSYRFLFVSAVFLSLTFYAYAVGALFTTLLGSFLLVVFRNEILRYRIRRLLGVALLVVVILIPYINLYISGRASERFTKVAVSADSKILEDIVQRQSENPAFLTKVFRNKNAIFVSETVKNYFQAFSTEFLFINGDPILRHSVGGFGQLHFYDALLILVGLVAAILAFWRAESKSIFYVFVLGWLLIAPIASSLTQHGGEHAARLIVFLPPIIILASLGLDRILGSMEKIWARLALGVVVFLMVINSAGYFYRYFVEWPKDSWRFWHAGYKETLSFVKSIDAKFERIYLNNTYEPMLVRFLFWYKYDPAIFQKQFEDDKHIEGIVYGFNGFKVGEKYYFGEIEKPFERLVKPGHLIVASARDEITNPDSLKRADIELLKTVYSPTGEVLFYILTGSE